MDRLPPVSLAELPDVLAALEHALRPIAPKALAVMLAQTLAIWRVGENVSPTVKASVELLAEFPPDVVAAALRHVRETHRYPTMPTPADFYAAAVIAAAPLRGALVRARLAKSRLEAKARQAARNEAAWAARKPLDIPDGPVARMPRDKSDGSPVIDLGDTAARMREWQQRAGA